MAGDELTITLFFCSTGIAFLLAVLTIHNWRNVALISALWFIAALMIAIGIAWHWLKEVSPVRLSATLEAIGSSPFAYVVLALSLACILVWRKKQEASQMGATKQRKSATAAVSLEFDANDPRCVYETTTMSGANARWFRLRASAISGVVPDCVGFLRGARIKIGDTWLPVISDSHELRWMDKEQWSEKKDLAVTPPSYLDVFCIDSATGAITPLVPASSQSAVRDLFRRRELYEFNVSVMDRDGIVLGKGAIKIKQGDAWYSFSAY